MTGSTQSDGGSTAADSLVRGLVQMLSESGETTYPMASTDAEEVIKAQLTENTGRHMLDSGGAYGRAWEENQENPPWEQPAWNVHRDYITHNVYDHLSRTFSRDRGCVALEAALYAFAYSDEYERDSWLTCMEAFAEEVLEARFRVDDLTDLGVSEEAADTVVGMSRTIRADARDDTPTTHNTYNSEFHELSQVLQGTNVGGPYSEYVFLQVHGGCDVRGGYTAPRVYKQDAETWWTSELFFGCDRCGWTDAESCVWDDDQLIYQPDPDYEEIAEIMVDTRPDGVSEHDARQAAVEIVDEGHDRDHQDGAVFHDCGDGVGHVRFH